MIDAPQVQPDPTAAKRIKSPGSSLPALLVSSSSIGMVPPDVLAYRSIFVKNLEKSVFKISAVFFRIPMDGWCGMTNFISSIASSELSSTALIACGKTIVAVSKTTHHKPITKILKRNHSHKHRCYSSTKIKCSINHLKRIQLQLLQRPRQLDLWCLCQVRVIVWLEQLLMKRQICKAKFYWKTTIIYLKEMQHKIVDKMMKMSLLQMI